MKRTPLKRKTPLKAKASFKKNYNPLKLKSSSMSNKIGETTVTKKKRFGLTGKGRSKEHVSYHEKLIRTGCIACEILGTKTSSKLCIHHWRGRNKDNTNDASEWLVMPLCWLHHDPGSSCVGKYDGPSVHGNKKLFVELVGPEIWCVHESFKRTEETPPWMTESQWLEYDGLGDKGAEIEWLIVFEREHCGFSILQSPDG